MNMHDLLLKPVITEKTTMMMSDGKYTFKVPLRANKVEIRKAVEAVFGVKVKSVATLRTMGKFKRMGKYIHSGICCNCRRYTLYKFCIQNCLICCQTVWISGYFICAVVSLLLQKK